MANPPVVIVIPQPPVFVAGKPQVTSTVVPQPALQPVATGGSNTQLVFEYLTPTAIDGGQHF